MHWNKMHYHLKWLVCALNLIYTDVSRKLHFIPVITLQCLHLQHNRLIPHMNIWKYCTFKFFISKQVTGSHVNVSGNPFKNHLVLKYHWFWVSKPGNLKSRGLHGRYKTIPMAKICFHRVIHIFSRILRGCERGQKTGSQHINVF